MKLFYKLSFFSFVACFYFSFGVKKTYDIRLKKIFDCSNPSNSNNTRFNIDIKRINETSFIISGGYQIMHQLDNDITLHLAADLKSKGEYKEKLFDNDLGPLCDGMKKLAPRFFASLFGNGTVEKMCPILKGHYSIESDPLTVELPNVNSLPFGAYRVKCEGHQGPTQLFCIAVFANVVKR